LKERKTSKEKGKSEKEKREKKKHTDERIFYIISSLMKNPIDFLMKLPNYKQLRRNDF
jgi:hypothetical protein